MNHPSRLVLRRAAILIGAFVASVTLAVFSPALAANPANHLVISEIKTHDVRGDTNEFIELYNPTTSNVSLAGWSLQYGNVDTPYPVSETNRVSFGDGAVIPAGGYYLVAHINYADTPMADLTYTFDLDSFGGHVFLVRSPDLVAAATDSTIIDKVGYGFAASPEGTAVSAPRAGNSIERRPGDEAPSEGNGIDTNNNAADFLSRSNPEPQNTGSARELAIPPTVSDLSPANDSVIIDRIPTISAKVSDADGIDVSSILLELNNLPIVASYDTATGKVSFTPNQPLREGTHTARLSIADTIGFQTVTTWYFTIDTIAPSVSIQITKFAPVTNVLATTVALTASDDPQGLASGVTKMQIAFDGMIDTEPWEPFSREVTRNLMNKEGLQAIAVRVMDKAGNVSPIATATTTLTFLPAPSLPAPSPSSATGSVVGNTVTITWPLVPGADSYVVRYSDGQTIFGPLSTKEPFIVISDIDPNKKYNFEVASVSQSGAVSSFTKSLSPSPAPSPQAVRTTAKPEAVPSPFGGPEFVTEPTVPQGFVTPSSPTPTSTVSPSPEATPGEIKGGETAPRDWTRVIVALSILIIAAGVATGGWYLYQWWTTRPKKGNGRGKGKGGRW